MMAVPLPCRELLLRLAVPRAHCLYVDARGLVKEIACHSDVNVVSGRILVTVYSPHLTGGVVQPGEVPIAARAGVRKSLPRPLMVFFGLSRASF